RDVLDIGGAADSGREIETRDLDTDAVTALELVGGRKNLDRIFVDLTRHHRLLRFARERMPRAARQRALHVDGAMRGLEPAAGKLAFGKTGGQLALTVARGWHEFVRADILEHHNEVGVVLIDRGEQVEHTRSGDGQILSERLAQIAQLLDLIGLARRHLY